MAGLRCIILLLVAFFVCASTARSLQQQQQQPVSSTPLVAPVQLGDGTHRIITRQHIKRQGGAIKALGRANIAHMRTKAGFKGTVLDLARQIDTDKDLAVDAVNKALLFVCEGMTVNNTELASGVAPSQPDLTLTPAQAFSLSSRPSATRKIFLDFDGHTTTGSQWNGAMGRDPIVSGPYDKDANPASWSADELSDIVAIWRGVSEDYAMFDVDVTTADPGASFTGARVVISGSYADWYGKPAGGVAYIGSFNNANQPAFVFPTDLGPNNAKFIMEAVSHEVGHTLGLLHDGTTAGASYYSGQGDWAPIMGSAYYRAISTFDKGEYTGSNNNQDDIAVIGSFLPLIPQQYGSDMATAAPLNATVDPATGLATAKALGVVFTATGDWFAFNASAGSATVSAAVVAPFAGNNRANLDILLTVYNAAGAVVAAINPPGADAASLGVPATAVTLASAGTYYIAITGAGAGDMTITGYSSYGSRGQFELTVVYPPCADCNGTTVTTTPSPALPSPSPAPVPSPSPAPLASMRVATISMSRLWANSARTQVYCTLTMILRNAAGTPLSGVRAAGLWLYVQPGSANFQAATAYVMSSAAGTVSYRSSNLSPTAGGSCKFSVVEATLAGYQLDTASSVMSRTLTW